MMLKTPLVSVIMTTYNGREKWISEAIESVLNQKYDNKELIIVDDGSTNNVGQIVNNYVRKNNNVIYLKNSSNLGCGKSSNKGIKYSKGKYIARIDDDDIRSDDVKLKKQVEFMEKNLDYGLVGAEDIIIINEKGDKVGIVKNRISDDDIRSHILQSNQFTHSSVLFRREYLERIGLYNESFLAALDYEVICRIGASYKFVNLEGISVSYRINIKGITKKKHFLQYGNARKVFWGNRNIYPNFYRAFILRCGEFLLPRCITKLLMRFIKGN